MNSCHSNQTRIFIYSKFSEAFKDILEILQNVKFLHLSADKIVGGPVPTLLGIKCGLQIPLYKKGQARRIIQVSLFFSNKVFHESLYIVVDNQNPDMNIIYLKTKELLCQASMAREGGSDLREQLKLIHKHSVLNFRWFMVWGMYLILERC